MPWACNRLEFHNAVWHVFVLLASGLWLVGSELGGRLPDNRWTLHEDRSSRPKLSGDHEVRWSMWTPFKTFVVSERVQPPK